MAWKKLTAIVLSIIFAAAGQAYSQDKSSTSSKEADNALVDAVSAMEGGDIKAAMQSFRKITQEDPANDAAWYYLGTCSLYTRDIKGAQEALKKACEIDPGNYWYKDRLAMAYSMTGEDDLTIATYEDLLKEFPKKNDIYYSLVNLYLKQNQLDKALGALDQIETVSGKNEMITSTRYDILLRQNKPEEAFNALKAYNEEYSSPRILSQMGDHTMAEYKDSLALAYYKEALDIQSTYAPALLGEAEVYRTRRDYSDYFRTMQKFIVDEEAEPEMKCQYLNMLTSRAEPYFIRAHSAQIDSLFDKLVEIAPTDSSALASSSMFSYALGHSDKAIDLMRRNAAAHPESVGTEATYIQLLGTKSDWNAMEAECDSALKRFPKETDFLQLKNSACYYKKDYQGIIDNSRKIIEIAQGDTSKTIPALAGIGDMYYELGNEKEAFKTYKQVLKINPDYVPVLNNYAYYLSVKGKSLGKAYEMSKKTIDKEPDNSTYLDTIGWILHLQGKDKEAKTYFKHAMLYGGKESATCMNHYATVLEALGETDLAKVYRTQAAAKEAEGKE